MSRKALVLYHSYSGNTGMLANEAAETLKGLGWSVKALKLCDALNEKNPGTPDLVILGTPVFYWTIPRPARDLIRKLPRFDGCSAFVFCTYGGCVAVDVPYQLAREMEKLGAGVIGGASVLAPHSSPTEDGRRAGDTRPDHGMGQPDTSTIGRFNSAVSQIAMTIETKSSRPFDINRLRISNAKPWARKLESLFLPYAVKLKFMPRVRIDQSLCKTCKLCEKGCETGSLSITEKGVTLNRKTCYVCYSCVQHCPSRALTINWAYSDFLLWLMSQCRNNTHTEIVF